MDKDCEFTMSYIMSKGLEAMKRGEDEIGEAMTILTKSHGLTLCQVWIPYMDEYDNEVKLGGYYTPAFKDYYDACVKIQDGSGGLALKALETYQPHFSRNIINNKGELQALLPATTSESCCCLAICLRNIYTGYIHYVFEFVFQFYHNNDPCVFLESLFLKLETCLPSFKFSSGAQLGCHLLVQDVDNEPESFNILAWKKQEEEVNCAGRLMERSINMKFWKSINRAADEIREALPILTQSHGLTLCQVWIHRYVNNVNEKCAIKLDTYCADAFKGYYDACVKIQDGVGELALKTLVTYQPYFSRNINIINKGELQALLTATSASESTCCLAICLRNIDTGDVHYACELFFSSRDNNDPCVFLDSLFLKLETCLPSFKVSYGAQLGPRLRVLDGDNLAANFDLIASLKQQEEEDCMDVKTNNNDNGNDHENLHPCFLFPSNMHGAVDVRFYVPLFSETFANLKTKISQRFHLVSNSYRLTYLADGTITKPLWVRLEDDRDLKACISYCTFKRITQLVIRVLPCSISPLMN
ncbi:uncharacterized protein [Rutidosis leptorrhynchoides]|uniref:uncharacterized protein n=1 Tax=Rutidosis leptorrhynchoides TaxID=125765 RepID=UPI003A98E161